MPSFLRLLSISIVVCGFSVGCRPACAVIIYGGTSGRNLSAPTGAFQDSGWQYEGSWEVGAGTAISAKYFLTARHLGGAIGDEIVIQGVHYHAAQIIDDPAGSDVRMIQIQERFASYAPLYEKSDEVSGNKLLTVFGRGSDRGPTFTGPNGIQGYIWGGYDGQLSWGASRVAFATTITSGPAGDFLGAFFLANPPVGVPTSSTLSGGDSGGGVFIKDSDGKWKLAAVNYAVDGPYSLNPDAGYFNAAVFDTRNLYEGSPSDHILHPGGSTATAQAWYASRVSEKVATIYGLTGVPEPSSFVLVAVGLAGLVAARFRSLSRRGAG